MLTLQWPLRRLVWILVIAVKENVRSISWGRFDLICFQESTVKKVYRTLLLPTVPVRACLFCAKKIQKSKNRSWLSVQTDVHLEDPSLFNRSRKIEVVTENVKIFGITQWIENPAWSIRHESFRITNGIAWCFVHDGPPAKQDDLQSLQSHSNCLEENNNEKEGTQGDNSLFSSGRDNADQCRIFMRCLAPITFAEHSEWHIKVSGD